MIRGTESLRGSRKDNFELDRILFKNLFFFFRGESFAFEVRATEVTQLQAPEIFVSARPGECSLRKGPVPAPQ